MLIMRSKRIGQSTSSSDVSTTSADSKRQRQNPMFEFEFEVNKERSGVSVSSVYTAPVSGSAALGLNTNQLRQLKNRESAERSRLKKDHLLDSLTCQVCENYVQLTDLMAENTWLLEMYEQWQKQQTEVFWVPAPLQQLSGDGFYYYHQLCDSPSSSSSVSSVVSTQQQVSTSQPQATVAYNAIGSCSPLTSSDDEDGYCCSDNDSVGSAQSSSFNAKKRVIGCDLSCNNTDNESAVSSDSSVACNCACTMDTSVMDDDMMNMDVEFWSDLEQYFEY